MTQSTTNFSWEKPESLSTSWDTALNACIDEIDASLFVQHNADGTHKGSANVDWGAFTWQADTIRADTAFSKNGTAGYIYVVADKDADGDFDALTATAWEAGELATGATGTINWNTAFGVPTGAVAVDVYVYVYDANTSATQCGGFLLKAKSGTTNWSLHARTSIVDVNDVGAAETYARGVVPISAAGTSYYYAQARKAASNVTVTLRVVGYFI